MAPLVHAGFMRPRRDHGRAPYARLVRPKARTMQPRTLSETSYARPVGASPTGYRLYRLPRSTFNTTFEHCVWLVCGGDPTRTPPSSTAPLWPLRHRIEILARLDRPPDRLAGRSVNSLTSTKDDVRVGCCPTGDRSVRVFKWSTHLNYGLPFNCVFSCFQCTTHALCNRFH